MNYNHYYIFVEITEIGIKSHDTKVKILNKCGEETDTMSFNAVPRGNFYKFKSIHETNECENMQTHDDFNDQADTNSDDSEEGDDSDEISTFYSGESFFHTFNFQSIRRITCRPVVLPLIGFDSFICLI